MPCVWIDFHVCNDEFVMFLRMKVLCVKENSCVYDAFHVCVGDFHACETGFHVCNDEFVMCEDESQNFMCVRTKVLCVKAIPCV
jgi:hypothetical protein